MYKVQVIMSTYNGEKYIEEQIKSIFNQKNCEIDLLIRDDGSTDNTIKIIKKLKEKYAIKLLIGDNLKSAKSFLTALLASDDNRDFYAFSDQDDVWKEDKIISAINMILKKDSNIPILYAGNLCAVDENLNVIKPKILPDSIYTDYKILMARGGTLIGCTMVFNKLLRDYMCENKLNSFIMHDSLLGIIASLKGKIIYDKDTHIYYRQHENNVVGAKLSFYSKIEDNLDILKGKIKNNRPRQAQEIYNIIKNDKEVSDELKEYTLMVANRNKSLKNKIIYLKNAEKCDLGLRKWIMHVIYILLGKL